MQPEVNPRDIAANCHDYESILEAQGYGISLANSTVAETGPRCDQCINWQEGYCVIYRHYRPDSSTPPTI